ncbi:MAG: bifunctional DNA-formamidopyrimidine glycosylase/DNA-(apurinic or apyrimidinic site) lyase [Blastocatellia bacterium]
MPELPEVEIVARSLEKLISGRKIASAQLLRSRLAPDITSRKFAGKLKESSVNFVHRRGKHILFDLENGLTLITHLRMTGRFMLLGADVIDPKFTHAVFYFEDGERLVFQDQRHFGLMKVVETAKLYDAKELLKLAPEPFSEEFSINYLRNALKSSKRTLKEFLLDQTKVCGLGNIYAAEAMFLAGVDPRKPAFRVSAPKTKLLHQNIREVLAEALDSFSTGPINREDIGGSVYGEDTDGKWRVYGRENEPCPNCKRPIVRLKQGSRSTFFCKKCQR